MRLISFHLLNPRKLKAALDFFCDKLKFIVH